MADQTDQMPSSTANEVIEFVNQARNYMNSYYWDELAETYRAIKCRTSPIMKKGDNGKEVEDTSRTNVCMPDLNLIWRRNVARMTAQPYRLKYIGGSDPMIADMLSALAIQQYDRSGEAVQDRRVVMSSEGFGWGTTKLYWDRLAPIRKFRRALMRGNNVIFRDRRSVMAAQGAPMDEIQGAIDQYGPELSDEEVKGVIGKSGNEINFPMQVEKYEGPCVKAIFPGDLFWDPSALSIDDSPRIVELVTEDELWLKKQIETLTYKDENGQDCPAFDKAACQELLDMDPGVKAGDEKIQELRQMFRNVVAKGVPRIEKRLFKIKRFDLLESHELGADGRIWVTWISENMRDKPLGRMPYPYDLYGKYVYTELVTLPDMISAFGDSTPRLLRYLHLLLNQTQGQNFDYVTNLLKPFMLTGMNQEISDEAMVRGTFRELRVRDVNGIKPLNEPPLPGGAFERTAEIWRMLGMAEPSLNNVDAGTENNPQAGKTATTAILNSKAGDALTQFKLIGRDIYCKEIGMKKLWMNQQGASEAWEIQQDNWGKDLRESVDSGIFEQFVGKFGADYGSPEAAMEQWALSDRNGKTVAIRLDPMEIQEDYQVEAEAGSYLSVDDDIRRAAATDLANIAAQAPGTVDIRKVARFALSTIRGIGNPDDYLLPEQSGPTPPRVNVNVNVPLDKEPVDIVNQLLPLIGLQPSQELVHKATLDGVTQIGAAAEAASKLAEPAVPKETPDEVPTGVKQ